MGVFSIDSTASHLDFDSSSEYTTATLCEALRIGNTKAFKFLYDALFDELYRYGLKIARGREDLAKDCVQEIFVNVWNKRESLQVETSFKFYLFKSLRRDIQRKLKVNRFVDAAPEGLFYFESVPSVETQMINAQFKSESSSRVMAEINKLPARQKEIVFLRYFEGFSAQEVSAIMDLKVNSAYVLLSKALNTLKDKLK